MADIYRDIAKRTGGNIYIGVVGPVRSGKSTLIKRFMDELVINNIADENEKARAVDELPQSASGKTVMTTEPKFIPENAVEVEAGENAHFFMKMIDCVGFVVPGAEGIEEDGAPRMVSTPWSSSPLPFDRAAELGTQKVIKEHSTVGVMVTSDGSFGELSRDAFTGAEKRTLSELEGTGKPFVIVLNSANPLSESTAELARRLGEEYSRPVIPLNCFTMGKEEIALILTTLLGEFAVKELEFEVPSWFVRLDEDDPVRIAISDELSAIAGRTDRMRDATGAVTSGCHEISEIRLNSIDYGTGKVTAKIVPEEGTFLKILSEKSGMQIREEADLLEMTGELGAIKEKYEKIKNALETAQATGYGIVVPATEDIRLQDPEVTKQAGGYGIRFKATAPSIHMIRANIETEVSPIIGSEKQSEDMAKFILEKIDNEPEKVWELNMFGKSLNEMINDELKMKLARMPDESRAKFVDMLQKVINEGSGGLICIIL
ncbi:MAG: stage IV sporulation protein A [Clostridia bacterium]|nr:stage IV sporulation protein A [Clostridia bacterium]